MSTWLVANSFTPALVVVALGVVVGQVPGAVAHGLNSTDGTGLFSGDAQVTWVSMSVVRHPARWAVLARFQMGGHRLGAADPLMQRGLVDHRVELDRIVGEQPGLPPLADLDPVLSSRSTSTGGVPCGSSPGLVTLVPPCAG